MASVPTIKMKKETAVITVNADQREQWEKHGYKVLEAAEPAKPAANGDDAGEGDQKKAKGKAKPAANGDK